MIATQPYTCYFRSVTGEDSHRSQDISEVHMIAKHTRRGRLEPISPDTNRGWDAFADKSDTNNYRSAKGESRRPP